MCLRYPEGRYGDSEMEEKGMSLQQWKEERSGEQKDLKLEPESRPNKGPWKEAQKFVFVE